MGVGDDGLVTAVIGDVAYGLRTIQLGGLRGALVSDASAVAYSHPSSFQSLVQM